MAIKMTMQDGTVIEGSAEELAELSGKLGISSEVVEEATEKLNIGDLAVISENAATGSLEYGDVVKITGNDESFDFITMRLSDGMTERFDANELVKATEEDVCRVEAEKNVGKYIVPPVNIEAGDIVRNEGLLYEVKCVAEPGYIAADEGVTLIDPNSGSGTLWRFAKNCDLIAKSADRKDR